MSKKIRMLGAMIMLIGGGVTFAIDTVNDGYQVAPGSPKLISAHGYARIVTSNTYNIFIPTKTVEEWTSFLSIVESNVADTNVGSATRTYTCSAKPGSTNTARNTVSSYTQNSTDGTNRFPVDDSTTDYNTSPTTTGCRYICAGGYTREGGNCINTRTYTCTPPAGQTAGTWIRNTVSSYTQNWVGSWSPVDDPATEHNTTSATTSCRFKCAAGYLYTGGTCQAIINGACGSATGATYTYPSSNHCSAGTRQDMDTTATDNIYNWNCNGINGGTPASCTAPRKRDGVCNNAVALGCNVGSWKTDGGQTACGTTRTWYCGGINGGIDSVQCSLDNPACAGICDNSSPLACSFGSLKAGSDNLLTACNTTRTWICTAAGGDSPLCQKPNATCNNCNVSPRGWINHGASVTGYNAPNGYCPTSNCVSQTRTCNNGTLGGSYTNAACTNNPNSQSCTITNGAGNQTCTAGSTSRGACTVSNCNANYHQEGNTCVRDAQCAAVANTCIYGTGSGYNPGSCGGTATWTCTNGIDTDSCSIANAACPVCGSTANTCNPGNPSGYNTGSCGGTGTWTCTNTPYSTPCTKANAACRSCPLPRGGTTPHGTSVTGYNAANGYCPTSNCASQTRTCTDGTLGGTLTYSYASCTNNPNSQSCVISNGVGNQSCTAGATSRGTCNVSSCNANYRISGNSCINTCNLPREGTITHGQSVTAYSTDGVTCPTSPACAGRAQTRTCNGATGLLSGSYTYQTCTNASNSQSCSISYGAGIQSCSPGATSRGTCNVSSCNAGYHSYNNQCYQNPACGSADGITYNDPPGRGGTLCGVGDPFDYSEYNTYRYRRCTNGATYVNCDATRNIVNTDCLDTPRGTVLHGNSVTGYSASSATCRSSCTSIYEIRTCNNGTLGGNYPYVTCTNPASLGICGSAENVSHWTAPSSNLCTEGTPSSVTPNTSTWNRTCNGCTSSDSCQAFRNSTGVCDSGTPTPPKCLEGAPSDVTPNCGMHVMYWKCYGWYGGSPVGGVSNQCSASYTC